MNDDGDAGGDVDSLAFFSPKRSLFQGWRLGDRQNHKRLCFHTQVLHTEAFTHKSIYTEKSLHKVTLHTRDFTHRSFYTKKLLHREVFTHRSFTQRSLYTEPRQRKFAFHLTPVLPIHTISAEVCSSTNHANSRWRRTIPAKGDVSYKFRWTRPGCLCRQEREI